MARKTEKLLIPKEYAYEHAEVIEAKEDDLE